METPTKDDAGLALNKSEAEPTLPKPHTKKAKFASVVKQGSFEVDKHFYTKVLKYVSDTSGDLVKRFVVLSATANTNFADGSIVRCNVTSLGSAQIHPLVAHFMRMDNERIISRYTHLYPTVDRKALEVTRPNQ
jgi:hypothetical protein